jgi:hypothetical protein
MTDTTTTPLARSEGLIVREIAGELLVYDTQSDRATSLNALSLAVWRACDGTRDVDAIAATVSLDGAVVPTASVWKALDLLDRAKLLDAGVTVPAALLAGDSRRTFFRNAGLAALVAVPLVAGITVPSPAQAASCLPAGANCTSSSQCCDTGACVSRKCVLF